MEPKTKKKEDLRIRMTYKLLTDALLSLLAEKSFEQISVTDICERASVHRTTFYKHFEDKYHLMTFLITDTQKGFETAILSEKSFENPRLFYLDLIKTVLKHYADNKTIYTLAFSKATEYIMKTLHDFIVFDIQSKIIEFRQNGGELPFAIPIPVIAEFHAGAILSLSNWWLLNDMPCSEDELVDYVDKMIF